MSDAVLDFNLWQTAVGLGPESGRGFDAASWRGALANLDYTLPGGSYASGAGDDPTGAALARFRSDGGDMTATAAQFSNGAAVTGGAVALDWTGDDAVLTQTGPWNAIKTAVITEFTGHALVLRGFVHNVVDLAGGGEVDLFLDGAKRGFVRTGDGNDTVRIGAVANSNDWSRLFDIATGDGADTVEFVAATSTFGLAIHNAAGTRSLVDLGAGDDIFRGGAGDDTVTGGAGSDVMDGGGGIDIAVFAGSFDDYLVALSRDGSFRVIGADGVDTVRNFEFLQFADALVPV